MLVEVDIFQRLVGVLLVGGIVGVDQMLHLAALEEVLGDDFIHVFDLHAGIERAFGIHDNDRAGFAKAEAAGADDLDFLLKAGFFDFLLEALNNLSRPGRSTTGTAAAEYMCAIDIHGQFLLSGLLIYPRLRRWCIPSRDGR